MKDSLLRLIDDLETKLESVKHAQKKCKTNYGYALAEGMIEANDYAIREIKKVLDDMPKPSFILDLEADAIGEPTSFETEGWREFWDKKRKGENL